MRDVRAFAGLGFAPSAKEVECAERGQVWPRCTGQNGAKRIFSGECGDPVKGLLRAMGHRSRGF